MLLTLISNQMQGTTIQKMCYLKTGTDFCILQKM